jgi:hypothetical protein
MFQCNHHHQGAHYMTLLKLKQAQILRSLMMVITLKHVGAVLM